FYQPLDAYRSSVDHHQSYQTPTIHQLPQASFPPMDSRLAVPSLLPSYDPIASLNKVMAFISIAFASRYLPTNNQLKTSSNPRNQTTIQDKRVTAQTVQGRQTQGCKGTGVRSRTTGLSFNRNRGIYTSGLTKVIRCYKCQEEGHTARQYTKPKRPRNQRFSLMRNRWKSKRIMGTQLLQAKCLKKFSLQ
nr:hypothetical protein [Tanacetum cinerariifolium]